LAKIDWAVIFGRLFHYITHLVTLFAIKTANESPQLMDAICSAKISDSQSSLKNCYLDTESILLRNIALIPGVPDFSGHSIPKRGENMYSKLSQHSVLCS
jgi:hypothetical protein